MKYVEVKGIPASPGVAVGKKRHKFLILLKLGLGERDDTKSFHVTGG